MHTDWNLANISDRVTKKCCISQTDKYFGITCAYYFVLRHFMQKYATLESIG